MHGDKKNIIRGAGDEAVNAAAKTHYPGALVYVGANKLNQL